MAIRVFISYSHDSADHSDRVWDLSERLRGDGIDCVIDQHETAPEEGWPNWCKKQLEDANFVLVACTETYLRRYDNQEQIGTGWPPPLNNLAELYREQCKYEEAEPLYQQSLAIGEKALGPDHPGTATILNNLAMLYLGLGKYAKAEPLWLRALAIDEKALGPDHPDFAIDLENLGALYRRQKRDAEAEPLEARAKAIREKKR